MPSIAPLPSEARPCVWLLCGGPSSEFDVSLASARCVLSALDFSRFSARVACLAPKGQWLLTPHAFFSKPDKTTIEDLFALLQHPDSYPISLRPSQAMTVMEHDEPVAVFNSMHGRVGEDGVIQGMFQMMGVPMTGSGVAASALAMDKMRSREVFKAQGLEVAKAFHYDASTGRSAPGIGEVADKVGFPCVVKPARGGSSLGMSLVGREGELQKALEKALEEGPDIVIEEWLGGKELTCGVVEINGILTPMAVTEIRPKKSGFFDYEAKYVPGACEEVTPASIPLDDSLVVQSAAMMAHRAMGCSGYSRSDFILTRDGRLYILEINTLPGMTKTSLLPQGAAAIDIEMTDLVNHMIAATLRERDQMPIQRQAFAAQAPVAKSARRTSV